MRSRLLRPAAALVLAAGGALPTYPQEAPAPETLNPLHGLAKDKLSGFRDRPLFNPARMEPSAPAIAPAPVPAPTPPEPQPAIRLVGIVSGSSNLAVIRPADGGKTTLLATGDKLGAWTVTVLPDGLRLQADTRSVDMALFTRGSSPVGGNAVGGGEPPIKGADAFPPTGDPPPP